MKESSEGIEPGGSPMKHSDRSAVGVGVGIMVGVLVGELVTVGVAGVGVCVLAVVEVGVIFEVSV